VGSIIVAAAVIIFLPDVLDGEKESYQADFEAIPKAPEFQSKTGKAQNFPEDKLKAIPAQELSGEVALDESDEQQTEIVSTKIQSDKVKVNTLPRDEQPSVDQITNKQDSVSVKQTLPEKSVMGEAWVIHLGSFKHKKNVDELMKKLKNNGYTAFTKPIKTKNGTLTKVIVGPELIKSELAKKIPALKDLTKVQGKIAKYRATK
jgi:DedD protein